MIFSEFRVLYIPFLVVSIAATVIASQAMISGIFSVVYQGITTRIIPLFRIEYTSIKLRSQIYIDAVNWMLLIAVLVVMFEFRSSENLASAYGLAVSGSMMISAIMMAIIFFMKKDPFKMVCAGVLIVIDFFFFIATFLKIPQGAYFSFILAAIPLILTMAYIRGQDRLHELLKPIRFEDFLVRYRESYASLNKIRGTALYFIGDVQNLSPYIGQVFFQNEIIYEKNILVRIGITDKPFGVETHLDPELADGLQLFTITTGYMDVIDIVSLLESRGIDEKTIFYGIETIVTSKPFWKVYSIIKRVSPPFAEFYTLPPEKMHGVAMRVVM
jgi:KUP system potassium uptake protein